MKRYLRWLGPLAALLVFAAAVWLLYGKLRHFPYHEFEEGLRQVSPVRVVAAAGLTGLYYLILVAYDFLAVRYVGYRLPLGKVVMASFTGYACSYNLGILLGGASVRYRLYSLWGLPALKIAQVIVVLGLTFWIGVFALGGAVFIVKPFVIPPVLHMPMANAWTLGVLLLGVLAAYLGICVVGRQRPVKLFGREFPLPPPAMGLVQIAIASADLMVGAAVFYLLIAPVLGAGYWALLGVYLLALVAGITTQVPGGMGVFELLVLVLLMPPDPPKLFAALVVWRAVFYLLPLAVAGLVLGAHELGMLNSRQKRSSRET